MADVRSLAFQKKSHRKPVALPVQSEKLAEFIGIMMGDGGINNPWQANISVNTVADAEYLLYLQQLVQDLFGIAPSLFESRKRQVTRVLISSVTVVDFLVRLGLPRGDKLRAGLSIPGWILENRSYRIACIRGLVDTDGCLFIHKHTVAGKEYKNIGFCFCSHSPKLISEFRAIFEEFGIIPHSSNQGRSIYLYKASAVARYIDIFGTSNERIASVYRNWRRG